MEEYKGNTNQETQTVISFVTVNLKKYHQTFPLKSIKIQMFFLTIHFRYNLQPNWSVIIYKKTNQKLLMFFPATFFSPFVSVETVKSVRYLLNLQWKYGT